ncbi:adenosylcobinamide-GDP ribazoletransferase [Ferrimonas senticii]|uniref:adenosylcobinamide-GDP ribazoletransferase n=1 Tax=Ferrimonas senticii TaxID=394566 RepID=UPI0003FC9C68|nr:adenosylcobinamide-GDP ribazoletransferase [Ferrimonas senticii]
MAKPLTAKQRWRQLRSEWALALAFLTRIPVPEPWLTGADVGRASRWFSWIGVVIGAIAAMIFSVAALLLPQSVAAGLTIVVSIMLTGALHQDGLADLCDGFWGGWTAERKLEIMKDSAIGSYGVIALIVALGLPIITLTGLPPALVPLTLLLSHCGSRSLAGLLPLWLPYARIDGNSKTPQKDQRLDRWHLAVLLAPALMLLILLAQWQSLTAAITVLGGWLLALWWLVRLMRRHIQGYTGDTLGATQQVLELQTPVLLLATLNLQG